MPPSRRFIRKAVEARMDPQLFALSYDYRRRPGRDRGAGLAGEARRQPRAGTVGGGRRPAQRLAPARCSSCWKRWLDALDADGRWALLKLLTGGLRVGVSARLAKQALADMGDVPVSRDRGGLARPAPALRRPVRLAGEAQRQAQRRRARPLPPGDAGPGDRRGRRLRQARAGRLRRRMEVGRHPRPGGQRGRPAPALQPHRRRHRRRLSRRDRRRWTSRA